MFIIFDRQLRDNYKDESNNPKNSNRLIRTSCFLGIQELTFCWHTKKENAENKENKAFCMRELNVKL